MTHLFRGWNEADDTGASNLTVAFFFGGSVSDARSHTITFQSFDAVKTYLEFLDQLSRQNRKDIVNACDSQARAMNRPRTRR